MFLILIRRNESRNRALSITTIVMRDCPIYFYGHLYLPSRHCVIRAESICFRRHLAKLLPLLRWQSAKFLPTPRVVLVRFLSSRVVPKTNDVTCRNFNFYFHFVLLVFIYSTNILIVEILFITLTVLIIFSFILSVSFISTCRTILL